MGFTRDEITLANAIDTGNARRGLITKKDVRAVTVSAVADSGAFRLTLPESLREKLGLEIVRTAQATLANGEKVECGVSEAVEVRWKDRVDVTQAWIVPRECPVLLGALCMEALDIMVDPKNQRLVGIHGDEEIGLLGWGGGQQPYY
jgi:clan AA aspartic protease